MVQILRKQYMKIKFTNIKIIKWVLDQETAPPPPKYFLSNCNSTNKKNTHK
jgi:hypothetical protein